MLLAVGSSIQGEIRLLKQGGRTFREDSLQPGSHEAESGPQRNQRAYFEYHYNYTYHLSDMGESGLKLVAAT